MGAIVTIAIVLSLAGGFIAYVGDRVGTRIGKKRLTSFGLRPRHTAMLWTVCSGGAIAFATLFVLLGLNSSYKRALTEGPEIIASNYSLKHENRALLQRNITAESQARSADAQASQAQQGLLAAQAELSSKRLALQQEQGQLRTAETHLAAAQKSLATTQTELTEAQERVLGAKRQLQAAQASVRQLSVQGDALAARNANLTAQNKRLAQYTKTLTGLVKQANTEPLIYPHGQELGRRAFPTGQSVESIRLALVAWLNELSQTARAAGAGLGRNGRAVVVATPPRISEDESLGAYALSIAKQAGKVPGIVVVADAEVNTFVGDQAVIGLHPYDNVLVYARGDVIVTGTINGAQSEDAILRSLQAFLIKRVRPAAQRQGIIPVYDPRTGQPSIGAEVTNALALADQIRQIGGPARVTASAAESTHSNGPLRLDLRVAPEPAAKPL